MEEMFDSRADDGRCNDRSRSGWWFLLEFWRSGVQSCGEIEQTCRDFHPHPIDQPDETGHREHHQSDAPGPVPKPEEQVIFAP